MEGDGGPEGAHYRVSFWFLFCLEPPSRERAALARESEREKKAEKINSPFFFSPPFLLSFSNNNNSGKPLDLRFIFEKAHAHGGYSGTTEAKKWASIAAGMGLDNKTITNAGWLVRTHYLRFLMPVEKAMREEGVYESSVPLPPMSEEAERREQELVAAEAAEAAEAAAAAAEEEAAAAAAAAAGEEEEERKVEVGEEEPAAAAAAPAAAAAAAPAAAAAAPAVAAAAAAAAPAGSEGRRGRSRSQQTRTPSMEPNARSSG